MNVEILSLLVLVAMFVVASFVPVNLGILALVAAFLIGTGAGGLEVDKIFGGFPGDLFILIVGVTYLFALANDNGTLQRIIDLAMRAVGNRVAVIPWLMFLLAAFVAAAGALSAASVAIVAPMALRFADRHNISPMLMGLMVVQGATAGSFSPLSPFGAITNGLLSKKNLPSEPMGLFFNSLLFNLAVAVCVFLLFGGIKLIRERGRQRVAFATAAAVPDTTTTPAGGVALGPDTEENEPDAEEPRTTNSDEDTGGSREPKGAGHLELNQKSATLHQVCTVVAIVGLVLSTSLFQLDVGFVALTAAAAITLMAPSRYAESIKHIPWSAVLLVCGVLTYVEVLNQIGTIDYLSDALTASGNPLLTALAASYIGGVISAVASTAGVLGASIPLAIPLLEQGALPMLGTISAIGISSSVVDVSPLSTNGALLVANQRSVEPRVYFRRLLSWALIVIALAPLLSWLIFVVL
ncbi:hypothetical protein HCC61_10910 [Streptomyces sp. HNM0575]|uniref:SLC13 family permease n=1 Tax=Streptomyces sp. HNM0575 TaxID=2716338 RepID=UPI00145EFE0C|nr:hypothetical protein [Streptomyces sp. HNM0575]